MINSALVSAQNRKRLYWVGRRNEDGSYSKVDVSQPEDRGILLKDVLDGVADREKSRAIIISSIGRTTTREYFIKNQGQMKCEPVCVASHGRYVDTDSRSVKANCGTYQHLEVREDGKTNVLTTVSKDNLVAESVYKPIRVGIFPTSAEHKWKIGYSVSSRWWNGRENWVVCCSL